MSSRVTRSQYQKFKKFAKKNDIKLLILQKKDEKNVKLKKRCDNKLRALPQKRRKLHHKSRQYRQLQIEEDTLRRTKYACYRRAWSIYHEFYDIVNKIMYEQHKKKFYQLDAKGRSIQQNDYWTTKNYNDTIQKLKLIRYYYFYLGLSY